MFLHFVSYTVVTSGVTRALIFFFFGGGGGCIRIYSCSARLISFELTQTRLISEEIRRAEQEYMNIYHHSPQSPINALVTPLVVTVFHSYFFGSKSESTV